MTSLPHPTSPAPEDEPPPGFVRVEETALAAPHWHHSLFLPSDVVSVAGDRSVPKLGKTATLALYQRPSPATDVEVLGCWLEYEVDPADWLDIELERLGHRIASRLRVATPGGVAGDVVAQWTFDDREFAGRFIAQKWGPRLYVVATRTAADDYAAQAQALFTVAASLRPLTDWPNRYAEGMTLVKQSEPFDWTSALPASWEIVEHPPTPDGAWFDATHLAPAAPDEQLGDCDGRMSMAVMTRACAPRPRDAANIYLRALRDNEVLLDSTEFTERDVDDRYKQAWRLETTVSRHGARGEVVCHVVLHEHAWIVAGVLGPTREDDVDAWMRNRRALDVALDTLDMDLSL